MIHTHPVQSHASRAAVLALIAGTAQMAAPAMAREEVSSQELCAMVEAAARTRLVYHQDPENAETRQFDIYGLGRTMGGNLAVYGVQQAGYSLSANADAPLPDWRTFRLDRLVEIEATGETFIAHAPTEIELGAMADFQCKNDVVPDVG